MLQLKIYTWVIKNIFVYYMHASEGQQSNTAANLSWTPSSHPATRLQRFGQPQANNSSWTYLATVVPS